MPKLGNLSDILNLKDEFTRMCNEDGSCSGCGECCGDQLPLSEAEISRIKKYIKKKGLKPHMNGAYAVSVAVDFTCPFRNNAERKCDIYEIRPQICRSFICSKSTEEGKHDRDLLYKKLKPISMRATFFGDQRCAMYFRALINSIQDNGHLPF